MKHITEGVVNMDFDKNEFKAKLNKILKDNPELRNFNLEFLKDINPDDFDEIVNKLKIASEKFEEAEIKAKESFKMIEISNVSELKINFDNYLETILNFPFALIVGDNVLEEEGSGGMFSSKYFGKKLEIKFENIFHLITVKRIIAMNTAKLISKHPAKFLLFKSEVKKYLQNIVNTYLKSFELEELFDIEEVREFNFLVKLSNKKYKTMEDFYFYHLNSEDIDKYKLLKAYLLSEFSIALVEF
jgi:hypothetical protein